MEGGSTAVGSEVWVTGGEASVADEPWGGGVAGEGGG